MYLWLWKTWVSPCGRDIKKGENTIRILVPTLEGGRNSIYPYRTTAPTVYIVLLQVEPLTREEYIMDRTYLANQGVGWEYVPLIYLCQGSELPLWLNGKPIWSKFLVHQPTSLEMWTLLGPVEYVDPPNAPTPIAVVAFVACGEGMGKNFQWCLVYRLV